MGIVLDRKTVATLALPAGKREAFYWDAVTKGFGLRVRLDAENKLQKTYVLQYRFEGDQRRAKLGNGRLDVDRARKLANAILDKVDAGEDPRADKEAEKQASRLTFSTVVQQYIDLKIRSVRPATQNLIALYLTRPPYFGPLHKMPLTKITASHVSSCLDAIHTNSGEASARQARRHLSTLFAWAMRRGHCTTNPVIGTEPYKVAPGGRERVLTDIEIASLWNAVGGDSDFGRIVRLLILTGARRAEIGGLRWSEIDVGMITLPKERTKNGRGLQLPLTPMASEIITAIPKTRNFLFGVGSVNGFTGWSRAKKALDAKLNIAQWGLHDLRRSLVTWLAEHGDVDPHIADALLNHHTGTRAGVAAVYQKAKYARQIRDALILWDDHLRSLIEGTARKILTMKRSKN